MDLVFGLAWWTFGLASGMLFVVFVLYPLGLWLLALGRPRRESAECGDDSLAVSFLVAVRNGEKLIGEKIRNCLAQDYAPERLEVVVFSDGSTDGTEDIVRSCQCPRVRLHRSAVHDGKTAALNKGMQSCSGDVVVFSDVDALLEQDVVRKLVAHFRDPAVGGVCGQRVISEEGSDLKGPQSRYIRFDSVIKALESEVGSITSNDGKLYSIRRRLFQPIADAVTDDLFVSLAVVKQGYRFRFEPCARAFVRLPSRNASHELERRRRIVSRSLRGIFLMRAVLNPFRYGVFALGLWINKVMRRLVPICLIGIFAATVCLSLSSLWMQLLLGLQGLFYAAALSYPLLRRLSWGKTAVRAASVPFYFCAGSLGTLLGLLDFILARQVTRWEPQKGN
jgi:cellulose synthase/poly-beta-1,6-N-acetylglucosamine synthase-like glycosyltransferase